jgi:hypothetical protein
LTTSPSKSTTPVPDIHMGRRPVTWR